LRRQLLSSLQECFGVEPESAETMPSCCGLVNGYRDPGQLGVDRWLAMIAAYNQSPRDAVVVDCGTAVTIDVVDAQGRHLGGEIIPGISAMTSSLIQTTRLMPLEAQARDLLGHSTAECVAAGIGHAIAAAIERVADEAPVHTSGGPDVIMTGGDAVLVSSLVQRPTDVRPHLVLEGLAIWAGQELKG
jgi:type III pantothenate kinase